MTKREQRNNLFAFSVGLLVTGAVVVAHAAGALDWLELRALDLRFRYANTIPQSGEIVCVDIDDGSLETVGRWPWERHVQAALIDILAECGARAIVVDLAWVEPQPLAVGRRQVDLLGSAGLELAPQRMSLEPADRVLHGALRRAGNAYLAFHYQSLDLRHSPRFAELLKAMQSGDEGRATRLADELERRRASQAGLPRVRDLTRLVNACAQDSEATADALAERTGLPRGFVRQQLPGARRMALRQFVRDHLPEKPTFTPEETARLLRALYGQLSAVPFENDTPLKARLTVALRDELSIRATAATWPDAAALTEATLPEVEGFTPVHFELAAPAKRCGFTVFEPDADGVTRRVPLVVRWGDRVVPQLAFVAAADALGFEAAAAGTTPRDETVRSVLLGDRRIQLDADGNALVPWLSGGDWHNQFGPRIPADALWQIYDRRRQIAHNERLLRETRAELFTSNLVPAPQQYASRYAQLQQHFEALERSRYRGDTAAEAALREQIGALEAELAAIAAGMVAELDERAADGDANAEFARAQVEQVQAIADATQAANTRLRREVAEALARPELQLDGKIAVLGYTATAVADMTPIPTHKRAPGVLAHANLLNGLLVNRLVTWAPLWQNALLTFGFGALACVLGVFRKPRTALVEAVVLAAVFAVFFGWLPFYFWTHWFVVTGPLLAIVLSPLAIALYRYVFIERERRQLATALSQYTSPEIARSVAEDIELCQRAEQREVTALFTDLQGFTTISEQIGAERTQQVLNLCLGELTDVLLKHAALVNKFLGDGIFAFWNPVIFPQADHAERSCGAALDLLTALKRLQAAQRRGGDASIADLRLRIGIATGTAVVGPCGSEQKYDYTCIGDSVNLAARLESANKFFGTQILVNDVAREAAGSGFAYRALGRVQVKGKTRGVPIFELRARHEDLSPTEQTELDAFNAAVARFEQHDWPQALAGFKSWQEAHPTDRVAALFIERCQRLIEEPPAQTWVPTFELAEK